jgi:hypothetical protein
MKETWDDAAPAQLLKTTLMAFLSSASKSGFILTLTFAAFGHAVFSVWVSGPRHTCPFTESCKQLRPTEAKNIRNLILNKQLRGRREVLFVIYLGASDAAELMAFLTKFIKSSEFLSLKFW